MVVHYLHSIGAAVSPDKANAPLIVYPNTVLASPVLFQRLQVVAWRRLEIAEFFGLMYLPQFALRDPLDIGWQSAGKMPMEKPLGIIVEEASDHGRTIPAIRTDRKAYICETPGPQALDHDL